MNVRVLRAGFVTTVQDLGRTGWRHSGVPLGGALDPHALRVVNALTGNDDGAAGIEIGAGPMKLQFNDARVIAWSGGDFKVRVSDTIIPAGHPAIVHADEQVLFDSTGNAGRAWLAISGGIDVPVVLGSRSTDLRASFGGHEGRALRDGDLLPLGNESELSRQIVAGISDKRIGDWSAPREWVHRSGRVFLRIVRGVDWPRFSEAAIESLVHDAFAVAPESDRMGVRLRGPTLPLRAPCELLSEPVVPGTIQVPPDGNPILLLNDCQTIGGYPKIAHVISVDLSVAATLAAGDTVRFHEISLGDARTLLATREQDFARFRLGLALRVR